MEEEKRIAFDDDGVRRYIRIGKLGQRVFGEIAEDDLVYMDTGEEEPKGTKRELIEEQIRAGIKSHWIAKKLNCSRSYVDKIRREMQTGGREI